MQTTLPSKSRTCKSPTVKKTLPKKIIGHHRPSIEDIFISLSDDFVYIPISVDKIPGVSSWNKLTSTPKHLFKEGHNVAIRTGEINNMTVIDFDLPKIDKNELDGMEKYYDFVNNCNNGVYFNTPTCRTQSGGIHLYFKYDNDIKTTTGVNGYSIDVRNDNALIICPPSVGKKGPYTWIDDKSIQNTELTEIPEWLKNWLLEANKKKTKKVPSTKKEIEKVNMSKDDIIYIYNESDIVELLDNLPKKYTDSYSDWFVITSCLKSEELKTIWDNWSKNSTHYDIDNNEKIWNSLKPKVNIMYLCVIARNENLNSNYYSIIHSTKRINYVQKEPNVQINTEYIGDIEISELTDANNIMVKSICGSGKTIFACKNIANICKDSEKRFLSISVRISMAYQQMADFKDEKFDVKVYKDLHRKEINKQDKLIIQIDSIFKLDLQKWHGCVLYLDETSSLLSYILTSTTILRKSKILCAFTNLVKHASQIICTDADLNDIVFTYFDKLGIEYSFIQNNYKNKVLMNAYEYENKEFMITKMEKELSDNKPFFACFDTKAEMEVIVERLKKYCEEKRLTKQLNNFLCYSSTEGDTQDYLIVNEKWKSKFIFYSPVLILGVSFVNRTPRKVFLFSKGFSINAFGLIQQISRCRNVSEIHYFISKKYHDIKYHCPNDVKEYYVDAIKNFTPGREKYLTDNVYADGFHDISSELNNLSNMVDNGFADANYETGDIELRDHVFNDMFFIHEYYDNVLRSAQREQFRWMMEDMNFKVNNISDVIDKEAEVVAKENIKQANKKVKENKLCVGKRALYNKELSLTHEEKAVLKKAKNRATYLGIDFSKKVVKKKYEEYLIDDKKFTQHYAFRLLYNNEKYDIKVKQNCCAQMTANLLTRIKLIKELEGILGVETLNIDTKRDEGRFNEDVEIGDNKKADIKREFRVTKKNEDNTYKFWYYQLIQMYKNLFGEEIFDATRVRKNKTRYFEYITNQNVLLEYS